MTTTREVIEWDWCVLGEGELLHFPKVIINGPTRRYYLPDEPWYGECGGEAITACGRRGVVWIAGLLTRMGAERCKRCCKSLGYPPGKGSPKNDDACRELVEARLAPKTSAGREES